MNTKHYLLTVLLIFYFSLLKAQAIDCLSNADCPLGEYCQKAIGDCDGVGTCWPLPIFCIGVPTCCGCDGITYEETWCGPAGVGVNVDCWGYCGECCDYLGDFNCDGNIDQHDFSIFASAWLTEADDIKWNPVCDISLPVDNFIDILDLAVLADNYLSINLCH